MTQIVYVQGALELLPRVQPLWLKLNDIHLANSNYFKHHYHDFTFEERCKRFSEEAQLEVMVVLACDAASSMDVAYCISSVNSAMVGEVDSLYVEQDYRKLGVGDRLMKQAMQWMDALQVKRRIIAVAEGNEMVLPFYQRYGFYPRKIILEYIAPQDERLETGEE